ncbi:TPA: NADH-quinone oxidoreductase subunit F [bacterium]|nr:NADH-quinone oxidoreductase subunit F [bacterium]
MTRLGSVEELNIYRESILAETDPNKICVRICMSGCRAYGAEEIRVAFNEEIKEKGLEDRIEIRKTGCHGFCSRAPVIIVDPKGIFYQQLTVDDVEEVVLETLVKGNIIDRLVYVDLKTGKRFPFTRDIPFYKEQTRNVLRNCGKIDPTNISHYIAQDGYSALTKILSTMSPRQAIEIIEKSGLRGRGGAGFPTGKKWHFAQIADNDTKYLICNASEGDPGSFKDRALLEGDPHLILEGMLVAGYAIGAKAGYIYIKAEYSLAVERLKTAILQAEESGLLGENILGSEFSFEIKVKEGAGTYVCGEETAILEAIEGRRGVPRPRPPFPAQSGLWNKPTNINNVETYANIPSIILNGVDWYSNIGSERSKGTKVLSLTGKINNAGLVEVPIGIPLRKVIFDIGGGIPEGKRFKAIQVGGPPGECIPESLLDSLLDFGSLETSGSTMGSGVIIVMDEDTCMVDIARFFLMLAEDESCGFCSPCRLGTRQMKDILDRIVAGKGEDKDIELLTILERVLKDASLCGYGQTCAIPVLTTIRYFQDEYKAHIHQKMCPVGRCKINYNL